MSLRALAAFGLGLVVGAPAILAQEARDGVARVDAQAEIQAALFHASATLAAVERAKDDEIVRREDRIRDLQLELERARNGQSSEVERLQGELTAAEAAFVAELADRDRAYAEEIAVFREVVEDIASTPEGVAALARFNDGDEIGALAVLDDLRAARDAARQRRADVESAAEARRIASLALEARQRGAIGTSEVIARYEEITRLDPNLLWDWLELSRLYEAAGDLATASQSAERALEVAESEIDRTAVLGRLGLIRTAEGDLPAAIDSYERAVEAAERRAATSPEDLDAQRDLSIYLDRLSLALNARGDRLGSIERWQQSIDIREQLVRANPGAPTLLRDLEIAAITGGDLLARSDASAALEAYRVAFGIAEGLASSDPSNLLWQRDLSVAYGRIGDLLGQQDMPGARDSLAASLSIAERLVVADPDNVLWLSDLAFLQERMGRILRVEGDLDASLASHQATLDIIERLMALDPTRADLVQRQSTLEGQIGWTLLAQDDATRAIEHFQASVTIARDLAARDSTNAGWQAGVAYTALSFGDALRSMGNLQDAVDVYDEVITHFARAMEMAPGEGEIQRQLRIALNKRGDILLEIGDRDGALREHEAALEIALTLAASHPADAIRQRDLIVSYVKMQETTGDGDYARRALEVALRMQADGILAPEDEWMIQDLRDRAGG